MWQTPTDPYRRVSCVCLLFINSLVSCYMLLFGMSRPRKKVIIGREYYSGAWCDGGGHLPFASRQRHPVRACVSYTVQQEATYRLRASFGGKCRAGAAQFLDLGTAGQVGVAAAHKSSSSPLKRTPDARIDEV